MRILPVIIFGFVVASCASTQNRPIDPTTLAALEGKTLTLIQRESPSFVAMTSGKGMFAVAGVGAAAAAGNQLVKENQIVDPAMDISKSLAQTLSDRHGIILQESAAATDSDSLNELAIQAGGSDYALDVVTNGWSFIYDGFHFSDYFVGYTVKLRLIDVGKSEAISSGVCTYDAKKAGKSAVTHEKLLENNAAYIKQKLSDAADMCIERFRSDLF